MYLTRDFNVIKIFVGYLMSKLSLWHNSRGYTHFPNSISLRMNVIAWQEFEIAYYDVASQHVIPTPQVLLQRCNSDSLSTFLTFLTGDYRYHMTRTVLVFMMCYLDIFPGFIPALVSFRYLLHPSVGEGATNFPGLHHFTLDPYLIMLSVKQVGIK